MRRQAVARVHAEGSTPPLRARVEKIEGYSASGPVVVRMRVLPLYPRDGPVKVRATGAVVQVAAHLGDSLRVKDPNRPGALTTVKLEDVEPADGAAVVLGKPVGTAAVSMDAHAPGELVWPAGAAAELGIARAHVSTALHLSVREGDAGGHELAWAVLPLFAALNGAPGKLQLRDGPHGIKLCSPPADLSQSMDAQHRLGAATLRLHVATDDAAGEPASRPYTPITPSSGSRPPSAAASRPPTGQQTSRTNHSMGGASMKAASAAAGSFRVASDRADLDEQPPTHLSQEVGGGVRKVAVKPDAWLHCRSNPPTRPARFGHGDGVDVYVDGARGLPCNATVTRAAAAVYNRDFQQIGEGFFKDAELSGAALDPTFALRHELREAATDPTATLLLVVYTVDRRTKAVGTVGYAVLPLFVDAVAAGLQQPANQVCAWGGADPSEAFV
jgi:hypothetical protein